MAKKKKESYMSLTKEDLVKTIDSLKKDLREMRFNHVLGSSFNLVDFKIAKKKLTQTMALLKQREIEVSLGGKHE